MGCGASKELAKGKLVAESIPNESYLKSTPESFITSNHKKFTEVYKVGKPLGSGSFGEVRSVTHRITNEERAAKIYRKDLGNRLNQVSFHTEIEVLKKLHHPIIPHVFEYFEDEKRYYLVLEKCSGGELFEEIFRRKFLTENIAALICKQLFSAIAYLHDSKVAHRDLKPENILLEDREDFFNIKIIDFGTAGKIDPNVKFSERIGSAFYIAPEVCKCRYTEKCDEWSCGVILYVLLCGVPPFDGRSNEEIISKVKLGKYSFDSPIWDSVSSDAKDLIGKLICTEKSRISAKEALLHPWIQEHGAYPSPKTILVNSALDNLKAFHSMNKLRNAIDTFIISQVISMQDTKELRELFKIIDVNGDGKISIDELKAEFNKVMDFEISEVRLEEIMKEADTDENGYIEFDEFIKATISEQNLHSNKNLKHAFDLLDLDGSGKISQSELQKVFSIGNLQSQLWSDVVKQADKNLDGEIDFKEFCSFVMSLAKNDAEN